MDLQREYENAIREGKETDIKVPDKLHPDAYYKYKLKGIVIHMGTADFGHYYSFIKD